MTVPQEIFGLVGRFDNNRESYRSGTYNETQLRREFVDPFFKILGWDVNNEKGYAEAYRDISHEDSINLIPAYNVPFLVYLAFSRIYRSV